MQYCTLYFRYIRRLSGLWFTQSMFSVCLLVVVVIVVVVYVPSFLLPSLELLSVSGQTSPLSPVQRHVTVM